VIYAVASDLVLEGLTLSGGTLGLGLTDTTADLTDVTVRDIGWDSGDPIGGIYAENGSSFSCSRCTITENRGDWAAGGVTITLGSEGSFVDSAIVDNVASVAGGGLRVSDLSTLTLERSEVSDNRCDGWGGGLEVSYDSTAVITDSTFERNVATYDGGAVRVQLAELTVDGSTFTGNGTEDVGNSGAIELRGTAAISTSSFVGNFTTAGSTGAIRVVEGELHLTDSELRGNFADGQAGALEVTAYNGAVTPTLATLERVTIDGNSATGGAITGNTAAASESAPSGPEQSVMQGPARPDPRPRRGAISAAPATGPRGAGPNR
jgi:hypothetical protein